MPPRKVITSAGIAQTMSSRCPEKAQFGRYVARVFEARNHQAKPRVAMITGTTIASMITTESMRISFSEAPMGPCGSSTPPQPESGAASTDRAKAGGMAAFPYDLTKDPPIIAIEPAYNIPAGCSDTPCRTPQPSGDH